MADTVSNLSINFGANTAGLKAGVGEVQGTLSKLGVAATSAGSGISSGMGAATAALGPMAIAAAAAAASIAAIGTAAATAKWGIELASQAEQTQASIEVLLGSASQAEGMIAELRSLAASTPLQINGLADNTKMLLGFGVAGKDILPTLKMLGDVSGGDSERMSRLSLAFGQISAAGRLMGQDLLQLINAGFNPLQEISKNTGRSMADLKKDMENGLISFDMVKGAFESATGEGGRFNGMMEKMSQTFGGKFGKAQEAIENIGRSLGKALLPAAKIALDGVLKLAESFGKFVEANGPLIEELSVRFANLFMDVITEIAKAIELAIEFTNDIIAIGKYLGVIDSKIKDFAKPFEKAEEAAASVVKAIADPEAAKELEKLMKRGESLAQSLRLPDEIYADTIAELKQLAAAGAITEETFGRAFRKAAEELDKSAMKAQQAFQPLNVGAVTRNSAAGFSAVIDGENAQKKMADIAQKQLEEERRHTRQNEEAIAAFRESTKLNVVTSI